MTGLGREHAGWRANWRVTVPLFFWLGLILVLAFLVFRYFILTFAAVAVSVALLLAPLQGRLTQQLGGRRGLAAGLLIVR